MQLRELHLLTGDLKGTFQFYKEVLDLSGTYNQAGCLSLMMGDTNIVFKSSGALQPYYHFALDIPVNQFEATMDWVGARVPLLPVPGSGFIADFASWNARSFYFYDNNHNIVEFICRNDADHRSAELEEAPGILYVSEIGIVTPDVTAFSDQLLERYNLEIFKKQPRQQNFTAIGDDRGLLIIAGLERNWYPTDKPSKSFPTKIVFHANGREQELVIE
jgi:hypothetical protein